MLGYELSPHVSVTLYQLSHLPSPTFSHFLLNFKDLVTILKWRESCGKTQKATWKDMPTFAFKFAVSVVRVCTEALGSNALGPL